MKSAEHYSSPMVQSVTLSYNASNLIKSLNTIFQSKAFLWNFEGHMPES